MPHSQAPIALLASARVPKGYLRDPAFIYRCENLGHALRAAGYRVDLAHPWNWRVPATLGSALFHRPRQSFRLWRLVRRLRAMGAKLIADVDDLVFDERLARYSPAVRNKRRPLWWQQRLFREHHAAIKWFDHITVSTDVLREHAHRCFPGKPVTVLPNSVHWHWRREPNLTEAVSPELGGTPLPSSPASHAELVGKALDGQVQGGSQGAKIITYLPGTRSHDRDFALIAEPLTRFLRTHPEVHLRVTGPVEFRLDVPPAQLEHGEKVPFAAYAEKFRGVWVNLAPLEDTPFNACKSALKAIEAGYWGIPTICSPNPDYARFAEAGALVAHDAAAWFARLERLLDVDEYLRVTRDLRAKTLQLADVHLQADRFVHEVLGRAVS